jgi:hypothetical protein
MVHASGEWGGGLGESARLLFDAGTRNHPPLSSEVKVVSKQAVFGGQVGEDDVRVVRKVARPDQIGKGPVQVSYLQTVAS